MCIVLCALIKSEWLQNQHLMRNHLFVINCRLRKKTQNCPKTSVFDQKTAIPWSIFPEKKRKTVPRTSPNFLRKQAFRHLQVQLCEIIPAYKNYLILSEQSERFNFSPQATHPVSNVIVHYAWIDQRGPTVVQVVSGLFPLFDNNESSESGESIFRSIRSIRR